MNNHPFIQWLKDESIPPKHRLGSWLPRLTPLVLGFRDLKEVFSYPTNEAVIDPQKMWINNYLDVMYKSTLPFETALRTLGLGPKMPFEDILRFIWNENKDNDRRFFYRICSLAYQNEEPCLRYAQIFALDNLLENVLFHTTRSVVEEYVALTGEPYIPYLSKLPPNIYSPEFISVELDSETREQAIAIAKEMMDQLEARWLGFLKAGQENLVWV